MLVVTVHYPRLGETRPPTGYFGPARMSRAQISPLLLVLQGNPYLEEDSGFRNSRFLIACVLVRSVYLTDPVGFFSLPDQPIIQLSSHPNLVYTTTIDQIDRILLYCSL